jgi:uncharacterized Zn finger protein
MGWGRYDREWDHYPPSRPIAVEGGVKAQTKTGNFGKSWWASRWIKVLESFDIGSRLSRGRSYARNGQVISIAIESGRVAAKVQGSRPKPYEISIQVKTLTETEWTRVIEALGKQVIFVAKLLGGEMPQDIEPLFQEVDLSLFPTKLGDLSTKCSCPDWSNPCKHIAAAYYLLGEEFDRDPFLLFTLRGMNRDALLGRLGANRVAPVAMPSKPSRPPEPLSPQTSTFWNGCHEHKEEAPTIVEIPRTAAALPGRLGGFPFWRGEMPFLTTLATIYQTASPRGLDVFVGPTNTASSPSADEKISS